MKKQFRITLNGKSYDVVAEVIGEESNAAPTGGARHQARSGGAAAVAAPQAPQPAATAPTGGGSVPSPLAGKVVSIDVAIGAQVQAGQQVMTLEAMKMNTVVSAPNAGTLKAVHVSAGDAVEEGQALLTID